MKKYIVLISVVLLVSCQENREKAIDSIKVWYYNADFLMVMAVGCDEIVYLPEKIDTLDVMTEDGEYVPKEGCILESIITNRDILREVAIELGKMKEIGGDYEDARMKCYISRNGQIDSLCIGQIATLGIYNGREVELTKRLVYLLRRGCGFYRWFVPDQLKYFPELNDSTFVREKVRSASGELY